MPTYVDRPSPNQSVRLHGDAAVRLVIAHTPEGSYSGTVRYITDPNATRKVSYHRLINHDGTEVAVFVPFERKAWHAGAMNSLSDGIAAAGFAALFDVFSPQARTFANEIARRLYTRKLPAQWTTDPVKGGFCRHADLQADRSDPTPDLTEWRLFVAMVQVEHQKLVAADKPWPIPVPGWFWPWAQWRLRNRVGPRPTHGLDGTRVPVVIPAWAWRRLRALIAARR